MSNAADPLILIVGGTKPRGRPRSPEAGSTVSAWIPESYHDRLIKLANLHDVSVSQFVGRVITREIDRAIE